MRFLSSFFVIEKVYSKGRSARQHAEEKVWPEIGRITKRSKKKPLIGLVGCMAQNYKEEASQRCRYLLSRSTDKNEQT